MWGPILASLASTLLPMAAKKLATIPIANQIFKTVSPFVSSVMPILGKVFGSDESPKEEQPVMVVRREVEEEGSEEEDSPEIQKPKRKYGKIMKKSYKNRRNYV